MTAAARSMRPPAEHDLIQGVLERDEAMRSLASLTEWQRAAIERGERLPRKSTFFWPKPRTGLLFMPVR